MPQDPQEMASAVKAIKEEIEDLQERQQEVLKSAAFLGMTPAIAKQIEERRLRITALRQNMMDVKRATQSTESPKIPDEVAKANTSGAVSKPTEPIES
jgi:hypothetical protein